MLRNRLEQVLADHGYVNKWHGTDCQLWQKGEMVYDLSHKGVELSVHSLRITQRVPYEMLSVKDGKLVIHTEVEL